MRFTLLLLTLTVGLAGTGGCKREKLYGYRPPNYFPVTRDDLHSVATPDNQKIWAIGSFAGIYHSPDGGATWQPQESGMDDLAQLCKVDFVDDQHGWIVGSFGIILHTGDGGKTWKAQDSTTDLLLLNVDFVDRQHGWAVGEKSTILRTRDGGATWTLQFDEMGPVYNSVRFLDQQTGWIVGDYGTILHTTDGGEHWTTQECQDIIPVLDEEDALAWEPIPVLFDVVIVSRQKILASGIDGLIVMTEDGGLNWRKISTPSKLAIYALTVNGNNVWAVGEKGNYLVSTDGGYNWKTITDVIKTRKWLRDVSFTSPTNGWVVGGMGTVVKTTDGGNSWEMVSGQSYDVRSVWD